MILSSLWVNICLLFKWIKELLLWLLLFELCDKITKYWLFFKVDVCHLEHLCSTPYGHCLSSLLGLSFSSWTLSMFVREYSILKLPKIERVFQKVVGVDSLDLHVLRIYLLGTPLVLFKSTIWHGLVPKGVSAVFLTLNSPYDFMSINAVEVVLKSFFDVFKLVKNWKLLLDQWEFLAQIQEWNSKQNESHSEKQEQVHGDGRA